MNILVLGNGFDLVHGLPTRYTDFLEWIKKYQQFHSYLSRKRTAECKEVDIPILKFFNSLFYKDVYKNICDEIFSLIYDNFWIDYFLNNPLYQKENWIDFESEISLMIQSVDNDMLDNNITLEDKIKSLTNDYLNKRYIDWFVKKTYKELRNVLLYDLHRLNRALEIYLTEYVDKMEIQKKSHDVDSLDIDHILSFNYTKTYERVYGSFKVLDFDYIHGKADISNTIEKNKIIHFDDNFLEKLEIRSNSNNFTEPKKHKFHSKVVKIIVEVIIGILISVVAGAILYKLNIN